MTEVGLREIRQHASEFVRRAEAGERMTITVSGRAAAQLGPVETRSWVSWDQIAGIFSGPSDPDWPTDRDRLDTTIADPWTR